jgi:hypothetical protein
MSQVITEDKRIDEDEVEGRFIKRVKDRFSEQFLVNSVRLFNTLRSERGDVPGWVLVVLMTTGLVTGIWTLAAPRIDSILRNSLDSMNAVR